MSKFFRNIMNKEKQNNSDNITNYLISEIEDIVSKKIGTSSKFAARDKSIDKEDSFKENSPKYKYDEFENNKRYQDSNYSSHVNYHLKEEQPFSAVRYIDEESTKNFLPFEERDMKPQVYSEEQIRSIVKRTLKPALNQWLDENLDIIIEKAIRKNYDKYILRPKKNSRYYYD